MVVDDRIKRIFTDCQISSNAFPVLIKSMKNVLNLLEYKRFEENFIFCSKKFMMVLKRDSNIERGIDFISKFTASLSNNGKENNGEVVEKDGDGDDDDDDDDDMHPFTIHFLNFLLSCQDAQSKSVRFRACQLVSKLLTELGAEAQIEDDLCDRIYEAMLKSVYDRCHAVRIHAVLALTRLQEPNSTECPVSEAYIKLLTCDPNSEVRKTVLISIAACKMTLTTILSRTLDPNMIIRKIAYKIISEKIHIKALTIVQRVTLVRRGINDRSEVVKDACMNLMVRTWLTAHNNDFTSLLNALYCQIYNQECQELLNIWLKKADLQELVENFALLDGRTVIPVDKLTPERAFYWRNLCQHIVTHKSTQIQALADKVVPTCLHYVQYLEEVLKENGAENSNSLNNTISNNNIEDNSFKLLQVVMIMAHLDVSDEAGRKAVIEAIKSMLLSRDTPSEKILCSLMDEYLRLHQKSDKEVIINNIVSIITDILRPDFREEVIVTDVALQREVELKLAKTRVALIHQQTLLEDCVTRHDFESCVDIKAKITNLEEEKAQLTKEFNKISFGSDMVDGGEGIDDDDDVANTQTKSDPDTLVRCLRIVSATLANKRFDKLIPSILNIMNTLVIPGVTSEDSRVREVAIECLGLCCVRDLAKGRYFMPLFIQALIVDVDEVKISTVKAVFNLLLIFGLPVVQNNKNNNKKKKNNNNNNDNDNNNNDNNDNNDNGDNGGDGGEPNGIESDPVATFLNEDFTVKATMDDNDGDDDDDDDEEEEKEDVWQKILVIITEFLDSDNALRSVSCEGLCKLLMVNRIESPGLLSRLVLLWYHPSTEDDPKLRQHLSHFFMSYAQKSRSNQEIISKTILPTMKLLLEAPRSSPLSTLKVENVAELLIHLSDAEKLDQYRSQDHHINMHEEADCGSRPHDEVAILLCNELLKECDSTQVKLYTKALQMLNISMENRDVLQSVRGLIKKIFKTKSVTDRLALKALSKVSKEVKLALQGFMEAGLDLSQMEEDGVSEEIISSGTTATQTSESVNDETIQYDDDDGDNAGDNDGGVINGGDNGGGDGDNDGGNINGGDDDHNDDNGNDDNGNDDNGLDATIVADVSKKSAGRNNVSKSGDGDGDDDDDFEPVPSSSRMANMNNKRALNNNNNNNNKNNNNKNNTNNKNNKNNNTNNNSSRVSVKRRRFTVYDDDGEGDDDDEDPVDDDDDDDDDIVESNSDDDFED